MLKFYSISLLMLVLASCANKEKALEGKVEASQTEVTINEESDVFYVQEGKDYEIMLKERQGNITNFYIKNITCKLNESDLHDFAKAIQKQVGGKCNIYIYSSDDVRDLMTKYPIQDEEYIKVADAFAYLLGFDGTDWFYPLQDIQYKNFGGKNWKKEPVE